MISHVDVEVSAEDIKDIYLGRKEYAKDQQHLIPVQNAAARKEFMSQVLRMKSKRYRIYWAKKSFQDGTMTPQMKMNDKETIQYIMHTPGAIGYTKTKPEGVKIIKKY
ncbi:MAG: phosphate ABC transporter substrate-binding protein [Nitrospira sp.]|nr:phosphate ABC transporter substrate-binding protein [bacterium]MBL7050158.1 phosphate ABC transporter substrate-binding protein [Nitrospira sp.]